MSECPVCGNIPYRDIDPHGKWVFIPNGNGFYTFPIPASHDDTRDDATRILDEIGTLRGAAPHITQLLDEGEDG